MKTVGIICEYNPLHLGHEKQIRHIRSTFGGDCAIVCLMSGNFVQRGAPAILDKSLRAKAAIVCGADLVLELPVNYALSSAEGFAAGGVGILTGMCDYLCFGSESGDGSVLMDTAAALLSPDFPPRLRAELDKGLSFPAARQAALGELGTVLQSPNDILAVEYCKAILSQNSKMQPLPILREGSYHAEAPDYVNPSATAVRKRMTERKNWQDFVPAAAKEVFTDAPLHTLAAGERAVLARLRTMTDAEFEILPYGSEGLWRKFMHNVRRCGTLDEILAATKSKRYTHTRLCRMMMCAYLGISREMLESPAPYARVLAFNDTGRAVLKRARLSGEFPNIGEKQDHPFQELETRCDDLYGLFRADSPAPAGGESARRVFYHP